jgi:sugar phosphate isomerase/epimerase
VVSNAWPQSRATEGATLRALEEVLARFPFFEAFQTVDVPFAAERRSIRQLLGGHPHTYTLTRILAEQKLNLSSLDPENRGRAVATMIAHFDHAAEAGAGMVAVISGARPADRTQRAAALDALEDSLAQLCAAAADRDLELLVEPLDYEAHKCQTLGTTEEALAICRRLAARNLRLSLCLDTAHLLLNGEDSVAAVEAARDFLAEFHFCNPVTDRASPLYGDQHPPFGPPGLLGTEEIAAILADLRRTGFLDSNTRPRIYCEVMKPAAMDSCAVIAHCQEALVSGWARARQLLNSPSD